MKKTISKLNNKFRLYTSNKKNRGGYSLLEMLVTLLIVNVIILMVSQVLVISLKISIQSHERSFAREELTNLTNLIRRDIRNSNGIKKCSDTTCIMIKDVEQITWRICDNPDSICKIVTDTSGNETIVYETDPKLIITGIIFEEITSGATGTIDTQKSILLTVKARHSYETVNIDNLYRQVIVSTRNYDL